MSAGGEIETAPAPVSRRARRDGRPPFTATNRFIEIVPGRLAEIFDREMDAGRGFLWLPVAFGVGILLYFAMPGEPPLILAATGLAMLVAGSFASRPRATLHRSVIVAAAITAGLTAAKIRTDFAIAPVMPRDMTVTVSGWVAVAEETQNGGRRVRLVVAGLDELPPDVWPTNVRVTIRNGADALAVGDAITVLASLSPPGGPVMPGGYDFSIAPFYQRIGGVGFAFGAAKPAYLGPPPLSIQIRKPLADLRDLIRRRIEAALPGDDGHIAAALIMGDQRGISDSTQDAMRASGLGHILSISGLHLALVAGSVFWLVRALLALSQTLALRYPIKKWAAVAALAVATFYLGISGAEVATVRSYVMLAIMLGAILLERRALTLRNVALAALVILIVNPESLLSISFQMSFAATIALIAAYEALSARADRRASLSDVGGPTWFDRTSATVGTLFLTSLIAGLATAPFGAFYFQRVAPLTIVANMAVAPVVGFVVMPMALLSVVAMPFGLEAWPLVAMQWGLRWMVLVAERTAAWSEGWGGVRALPAFSLLLMVAGFLWLALWRQPWRLAGLLPIAVAIPIAVFAPRPDLIVDEDAKAVAVRGSDGGYRIIGGRGANFEIETWLRADADPRKADAADLKQGIACDPLGCVGSGEGLGEIALVQRREAFGEDCRLVDIVISRLPAPPGCDRHAHIVIDRDDLDRHGAHAFYLENSTIRVETAYPENRRPFMPPVRD